MTSLIQFVAILVYVAVFNVLSLAVYLWVDERLRGGRIGGGACPQAPPRADPLVVQPDSEWWLR